MAIDSNALVRPRSGQDGRVSTVDRVPTGDDPASAPLVTADAANPATVSADTTPVGVVPAPGIAPSRWTFTDVIAGLGLVFLLGQMVAAPFRFTSSDGGPLRLVVGALPVWIGLLGTAIWACRRHGTGRLRTDLGLKFKPVDLAIGLGAGLGLRFAVGAWAALYSSVRGQRPSGNLQSLLGNGLGTGVILVANALAIAVIGPVIEEIFFRGVGLRSALASLWRRAGRGRLGDPRLRARYAVLLTSAVFAVLHVSEVGDLTSAVVLLPGLFLAGWVMARLTMWSGRLGPAIITHVVFNSVAVVALLALN